MFSQVGINADNSIPDPSAMLDVKSTSKGILVPRMTTVERNTISNPATGLLIFCRDNNQYYTNKGTPVAPCWVMMSSQWMNNETRIYYTLGKVGIGTSDPQKLLDVHGDILVNGLTIGKTASVYNGNTAVGDSALFTNPFGSDNTAIGYQTMYSNMSGTFNTAMGALSLYSNTHGIGNTALGHSSLLNSSSGSNNTALGYLSGSEAVNLSYRMYLATPDSLSNGIYWDLSKYWGRWNGTMFIKTIPLVDDQPDYVLTEGVNGLVNKYAFPTPDYTKHIFINVMDYGADNTGLRYSTAAIQFAINALGTNGGTLYFPAGKYRTTGEHIINQNTTIMGDNGNFPFNIAAMALDTVGSNIICMSPTNTLFVIYAPGCSFKDISLINNSSTTPTSGSGIYFTNASNMSITNCSVHRFWCNIRIEEGLFWKITNSNILKPVKYGLWINNPTQPDLGDATIMGSYFGSSNSTSTSIYYQSSGGLKISDCKFVIFNNPGATLTHIDAPILNSSSIFQVINCSFEWFSDYAIHIHPRIGQQFNHIIIANNQFTPYTPLTGNPISIHGNVTSVIIDNNIFYDVNNTEMAAIDADSVNGLTAIGNNFNGFTNKINLIRCTNIDTCTNLTTRLKQYLWAKDSIPGIGILDYVTHKQLSAASAGGGGATAHYIGELFGGGVIFWVDNTGQHGLIVSLIDISTSSAWSSLPNTLIGPAAQSTWDGENNSIAMIAQSTTCAAKLCDDYTNANYGTGIYSDWYLPAILQLSMVYHSGYILNKNIEGVAGAHILTLGSYWSSTENGISNAWGYYIHQGNAGNFTKVNLYNVRAIRTF